jgi:starch phosphorylase
VGLGGGSDRVVSRRGDEDLARAEASLASRLPGRLGVFAKIALNYRWSWHPKGEELFGSLDPLTWAMVKGNPVRLLLEADGGALWRAAEDPEFVERGHALNEEIQADLARPPSIESPDRPVAFFCAEYGIHRSLPTYNGGLGTLAGDVLKEASDQAVPMVGVGIMYQQGVFHQRLDTEGWQHEYWIDSDPVRLPMALVTREDGAPLTVTVPLFRREVTLQIWRVDVGRVPLYLLDAQRPENTRRDRWITTRLYVGDRQIRLAQYAVLGQGGIRALEAMDIDPSVIHLNEGHAALAPLELTRRAVAAGAPFAQALADARARTVFTTHTPVPAGNETYGADELRSVLDGLTTDLGVPENEVLALGRSQPEDEGEPLGLTVLAIRTSRSANAVSRLHGQVTRVMWQHLFPHRPVEEVPITHVTNGVHLPTWMAPSMQELLDRYLEEGWRSRAADPETWAPVDAIPDHELWAVRSRLRAGLAEYVRDRSVKDRLARGEHLDYAQAGAEGFEPGVLTVGFARRVAAYKRLHLLTLDPERAVGLLTGPHPIQLAVAGKAHPQDQEAKDILHALFRMRFPEPVAERVAFLEDYDMETASWLVSGCDVWVNAPRPPLEASGTSGMKSALNGGLNLSVADGWWEEAFDGTNGWSIASDPALPPDQQDAADADAFYAILEREVAPLFSDRDADGVPHGWVARIKASLRTVGPRFCAARMVHEYVTKIYERS